MTGRRGEECPELVRWLSEADATVVFTLGDHVALRPLARELRTARGADRDAARAQLERRLAEHAEFEERTLFPALQETLGCDHLAALGAEIALAPWERKRRPAEGPSGGQVAPMKRKGTKR